MSDTFYMCYLLINLYFLNYATKFNQTFRTLFSLVVYMYQEKMFGQN